mgnify:CR=1 FL=1
MVTSTGFSGAKCIHTHHFFNPLCKDQSLLKRVAHVAFHVLTLGIPLALYHIISYCHRKIINLGQQNKKIKPYSDIGQKAMDFAIKQIKDNPGLVPHKFGTFGGGTNTYQPIDERIALLQTLCEKKHEESKQLMAKGWINNEESIKALDEYMQLVYALSCLTLGDLPAFTEDLLQEKQISRTYEEALNKQDAYQCHTFYACSYLYHDLRSQCVWEERDVPWDEEKVARYWEPEKDEFFEAFACRFYTKGTMQNRWNELYNDYCDRARLYADEKKLESRLVEWIKKDTGMSTFFTPSSSPT